MRDTFEFWKSRGTKTVLSVLALTVAFAFVLAGCTEEVNPLVGTWADEDGYIAVEFFPDGNGIMDEEEMTWAAEGGRLQVTFSMWGLTYTEYFDYEVSGDTLILREEDYDDWEWVLTRVR